VARTQNTAKVSLQQRDTTGFHGNIRSGSHRDADVGLRESRTSAYVLPSRSYTFSSWYSDCPADSARSTVILQSGSSMSVAAIDWWFIAAAHCSAPFVFIAADA
jgi:uncharacterized protein YchJ